MHDQLAERSGFEVPDREINIDEYVNYDFDIWVSTPVILWIADRKQEKGIYVHKKIVLN